MQIENDGLIYYVIKEASSGNYLHNEYDTYDMDFLIKGNKYDITDALEFETYEEAEQFILYNVIKLNSSLRVHLAIEKIYMNKLF